DGREWVFLEHNGLYTYFHDKPGQKTQVRMDKSRQQVKLQSDLQDRLIVLQDHVCYLIERETKILEMVHCNIALNNEAEHIQDIAKRVHFGWNKEQQEKFVGTPITKENDFVSGYCVMQTVKQNMEGFTDRQVKGANNARSGYHTVGALDMKVFKLAWSSERLGGVPAELTLLIQHLDLCVDLVFINNVVVLTRVDKQGYMRHYIPLPNRTKKSLYDGIDKVFQLYNHADFRVKTIHCNQEFKVVFDDVKDALDVHMNYTSTGEHEPTAEHNNKFIKARFRTAYHRMPYQAIPKKRKMDYAKECIAEIGA
ncbi:MAG: hypothetical protein SGBAC_007902, partial [Bacillariaceae sp.]